MDSSSEGSLPVSYAIVVRGSPSPSNKWLEYQKKGDAEATEIALLHSINDAYQSSGKSDQSDSIESLSLTEPTPGFGTCPRAKKRAEVFETWEEEVYFPGEPWIPLGSCKFIKHAIKMSQILVYMESRVRGKESAREAPSKIKENGSSDDVST